MSSYDIINENKKFIFESATFVRLGDTNYSNVKFDTDGTQNDSVNKALLDDIQRAATSVGIVATITTAKTGHNTNVKDSDRVSRHMNGTGLDVAILNGIKAEGASNGNNGNAQFRELGDRLKTALVSMGYVWNTESGNDKAVMWQTNTGGNHFNHLHISNRTGTSDVEPTASGTTTSGGTSTTSGNTPSSSSSFGSDDGEGGAYQFAKTIGSKILNTIGIKESFDPSSFGRKIQVKQGRVIIPKGHNSKINSPTSGRITNVMSNKSCINQIAVQFVNRDDSGYLEYCGITNPAVKLGDRVSTGDLLGTTNNNVTVTLYTERKQLKPISSNTEDNSDNDKGFSSLFNRKKKENNDDNDDDKRNEPPINADDEYSKLLVKGYRKLKKSFYPSEKKVNENIERIKKLL